MNEKPVQGNRFEDLTLEAGAHYLYAVRAVVKLDGETVESAPSNEVAGALSMPEE